MMTERKGKKTKPNKWAPIGGAEESHRVHPWQSLAPRDDLEEPRGKKKKKTNR